MGDLSITNVVNVSVSQAGTALGKYNTSNLALFTADEKDDGLFGTDPYKIYLDAIEVGKDFGTSSHAYNMALAVFSQNPNILAGNGYLVIVPLLNEVQTLTFDLVPDGGAFKIVYGAETSTAIAFGLGAASVQTILRTMTGLEEIVVTGDYTTGFVLGFHDIAGDVDPVTFVDNTLVDGATPVVITNTETVKGETLSEAIIRTESLIQYFGIIFDGLESQADMLVTAATVQTLDKMLFVYSNASADIEVGGKLDLLRSGTLTHSRGLYYGGTSDEAIYFAAAYAGRALSTNFSGSNTTQTMHLKDLATIQPDLTIDQTALTKCQAAGVDVYISIEGVAKTFTSGLNEFFDDIYNLLWFVGAIKISGFNVLATVSTKIPQTEDGVSLLKSAYRKICEQGINNLYLAPGVWNNPTTFGVLADLHDNVSQRGYYIYSTPIALQSQVDREAREAPLIQIAIKYAGAEHKSSVIVNINK